VIRLGALGDVLRTLPAVRALRARRPDAHLTWLVEPSAEEAVRRYAEVDEVLVFPRPELEACLSGMRWVDLVLDFHSILKSGVLARLSGAPVRVAYAPPLGREGGWRFATRRIDLGDAPISRFARNMALVDALWSEGRVTASDDVALIRPAADARDRMARALGQSAGGVVLHPGTSPGTEYKRWPVDRYGALARALRSDPGLPVWVSAGPQAEEERLADAVVDASGGAALRAPETPRLDDLGALFAESALFVGSDSGALHVASLAGTPVVQIMGPTHPVENEPWTGTAWRRARVSIECSPCRRGCAEPSCMLEVTPEHVAAEARALLAESRSCDPSPLAGPVARPTCAAEG